MATDEGSEVVVVVAGGGNDNDSNDKSTFSLSCLLIKFMNLSKWNNNNNGSQPW